MINDFFDLLYNENIIERYHPYKNSERYYQQCIIVTFYFSRKQIIHCWNNQHHENNIIYNRIAHFPFLILKKDIKCYYFTAFATFRLCPVSSIPYSFVRPIHTIINKYIVWWRVFYILLHSSKHIYIFYRRRRNSSGIC